MVSKVSRIGVAMATTRELGPQRHSDRLLMPPPERAEPAMATGRPRSSARR